MESKKVEVCKDCKNYDRCTKKCVATGKYTSRKQHCEKFASK
ncbi:hypothetical protein AALD01_02460 [Oscillospiraceae bacterium 21-37]